MQYSLRFPTSAYEHAAQLHRPGGEGKVFVGTRIPGKRWRNEPMQIDDLPFKIPFLRNDVDTYISQNRFDKTRHTSSLSELNALYIDIDYYKIPELCDVAPEYVYDLLQFHMDRHQIIAPSLAMSSGQGMYLVWYINPVASHELHRWNEVQRHLYRIFSEFGTDRKALDASRVLRLIGTQNMKNGAVASWLGGSNEVWNFEDIYGELAPPKKEPDEDPEYTADSSNVRDLNAARYHRNIPPATNQTWESLWSRRSHDLRILAQKRWDGKIPEGFRNVWIHLQVVALTWVIPLENLRDTLDSEISALTRYAFGFYRSERWDDRNTQYAAQAARHRAQLAAQGKRIEYDGKWWDPRYHYNTASIVELLEITEREMRDFGLRSLVSSDVRREIETNDRREKRRAYDPRRGRGAVPREIYESQSASRLRPWEDLGISRRTYYRRRASGSLPACGTGGSPWNEGRVPDKARVLPATPDPVRVSRPPAF